MQIIKRNFKKYALNVFSVMTDVNKPSGDRNYPNTKKISVFWVVESCSLVEFYQQGNN